MSEWITDRKPTKEDADLNGCVWATYDGHVSLIAIVCMQGGEPWMPTNRPEPYVKPKRHFVKEWETNKFCVFDRQSSTFSDMFLKTREAAQHIADAYNEVMP